MAQTSGPALQKPTDYLSQEDLGRYRVLSNWRGAWMIAHCWGVILLTWLVVFQWTNPLTVLLGIAIIGTRQLGLFVLSHDGAHYTLFSNRHLNDWASEWLLSRAQLGGSIHGYRRYHLQHHRHTQQEEDPDLALSKPFPISAASFRRKVIRDLTGQTGVKQYGAGIREAFAKGVGPGMKRLGPNLLINLVFFTGFAWAGKWYLYFLLWWVPALTWNRLVTRLRNIAEHAAVPDDNDRLRNTRTTTAGWLERTFIAPYFVNYHLEHHLLVNAPCYRLPQVHRHLLQQGLGPSMEIRRGYRATLGQAITA
ncbi:MAG: fatty acid desaturase family protein [Pseudomonadales bacterium]